jgi:predicted AlkP superfamily pyrophosphatase or phosphodiesterase
MQHGIGIFAESYFNSLIRNGAALPFTAHVAPPTVTLPRIKAITTGSIPGFADVMGNLDQTDNAFFTSHDSWLGQLRAAGRNMVFYGDDTWLRLSASKDSNASFFMRSEGVHGWLTSVLCFRHLASRLTRADRSGHRNIQKSIEMSPATLQARWRTATGTR